MFAYGILIMPLLIMPIYLNDPFYVLCLIAKYFADLLSLDGYWLQPHSFYVECS